MLSTSRADMMMKEILLALLVAGSMETNVEKVKVSF